jgi:hypothetical protein
LTSLLEVGVLGVLAWTWLFVTFCRRTFRRARELIAGDSDDAWLLAGLSAAVGSFAFGMLFYDAFAFIQVTIVALLLIALGSIVLQNDLRPSGATS